MRITSDIIPFGSHDICEFDWQSYFSDRLENIGKKLKDYGFRVTMHPGQYTVLNSIKEDVYRRSLEDLRYHTDFLDFLGLDRTAKVNIHVGGVYGDKERSKLRFEKRYRKLPESIKRRLVIENDDKSYTTKDCLDISKSTGIPVTFDNLHHSLKNNGESLTEIMELISKTWRPEDGRPIVHYSSQAKDGNPGSHAETLDLEHFRNFIKDTVQYSFDLVLEIKDKEKSAAKAIEVAREYVDLD